MSDVVKECVVDGSDKYTVDMRECITSDVLVFDDRSIESVRENLRRVNIHRTTRYIWIHVNIVVVIDRGNVNVMGVH